MDLSSTGSFKTSSQIDCEQTNDETARSKHENKTMSRLECARVSIGEERDHMEGKCGGRQRTQITVMVTFHDACDTMATKANRQQLNRTPQRRRRAAAMKQKEKENEEGGSKEVKNTEAKKIERKQRPEQQQHGKKGKHHEKRTKKKMSRSLCYKRM